MKLKLNLNTIWTNIEAGSPPRLSGLEEQTRSVLRLRYISALTVLTAMLFAATATTQGAIRYVRAGATGFGNGSDWNNAYTDLPATLVRGDTYFVADGTYGSPTFDDNATGTNIIFIKKATAVDHGTDAGWQSSYGDGQAVFGPIYFARPPSGNGGYYDMNGYSATVPRNCGFKISTTWHQTSIQFGIGDTGNHPYTSWRYIEMAGPGGSGDYDSGSSPWLYAIYAHGNSSGYDTSHMLVSHCYIHGITTLFQDLGGNNHMTVEYSELCDSRETGIDHGNIYWVGSSHGTFRYNKVYNYNVEGLYFGGSTTGWSIYGNIFYDGVAVARGIEFRDPQTQSAMKIYNNTFVNLPLPAVRAMAGAITSGVEIKNNLLVNTSIALENGGAGITLANNITTNISVFVSYAAKDFRLAVPIGPGSALGAGFEKDADGKTRGTDGVWDVGAYEYGGAATGTNAVIRVYPATLDYGVVAANASATNSITIYNAGGGTLTGSASLPGATTNFLRILSGGTYSLGSGQSQTLVVRYTPTTNAADSGIINCSGGGGALVNVTGALLPVLPGLTFPSYAGSVTAPFTTNGGYVSQTVDAGSISEGGEASYAFEVPTVGNYVVSAVVSAPSAAENSFFMNIDSQPTDPTMIWDVPPGVGFMNRLVSWRGNGTDVSNQFAPAIFSLSAGTHRLIFRGREPGVRLGQITILPYGGQPLTSPSALRVVQVNK